MPPMISRLLLLALLMFAAYTSSQQASPFSQPKGRPSVPDSSTAIKIAKSAARILDPEPKAKLENGLWTVSGRACCNHKKASLTCEPGQCLGGGVRIVIRESDGKVLSSVAFK